MARRFILALFVVSFVAASGCRTCDNPYDDCGPVVDAGFHPAGFRAGGGTAMSPAAAELIPAPPPPPSAPAEQSDMDADDAPPSMGDLDTTSVMRPRLRYVR